jgi:hypothetical protein
VVILIILGIVVWLGFGVLDAGFTFAFFQGHYPSLATEDRRKDFCFALMSIPLGPLALLSSVSMYSRNKKRAFSYGWRLK